MAGIDLPTAEYVTELLRKIEGFGDEVTNQDDLHISRIEVASGEQVVGHLRPIDEGTWTYEPVDVADVTDVTEEDEEGGTDEDEVEARDDVQDKRAVAGDDIDVEVELEDEDEEEDEEEEEEPADEHEAVG
jgi:hypothetical protein